jgi:hypothetical protein
MRLRAHDHYTSSTLIGGKGGASPSSLHTTLEGPTEYVHARWDVKPTWIPTWHRMDHVPWSLVLFSKKPSLEGRFNTKPGDHGIPNTHTVDLLYFITCENL